MRVSKTMIFGLISIIMIFLSVLYWTLDAVLIPETAKLSALLNREQSSEFYFFTEKGETIFSNRSDIREFSELVVNKTAERVTHKKANRLMGNTIAVFDYGYKGRTIKISQDGRILIYVSKTDIRNKSRLHWLWWKCNAFIDNSNYLIYITEADKRVADKILEIKSKKVGVNHDNKFIYDSFSNK